MIKIIIATILLSNILIGQEKFNYLLTNNKNTHYSGFGGFNIKMSNINKQMQSGINGFGGFMINNKISLSFGGFGSKRDNIYIGYGGVKIGFHPMASSAIHPAFGLFVGRGGIGETKNNIPSLISVLELNADIELNIAKWLRIIPSIGYRTIYGDSNTYTLNDFEGLTYNIAFNFGYFGNKRFKFKKFKNRLKHSL
jgi:hypothetical protein